MWQVDTEEESITWDIALVFLVFLLSKVLVCDTRFIALPRARTSGSSLTEEDCSAIGRITYLKRQ